MFYFEYKAQTFNGNLVVGRGATLDSARRDATEAAEALGTCIRKVVSVRKCVATYAEGEKAFTWKFPV